MDDKLYLIALKMAKDVAFLSKGERICYTKSLYDALVWGTNVK